MEVRDLSFTPVANSNPEYLTADQIDFYNTNGYIRPLSVFGDLEAEVNRSYFNWQLARVLAARDGRDPYSINGFHTRWQGLYDICTHPMLLNYVQDIIGPDVICWGSHFFCKLPQDPKMVPWHQDASYWPLNPARTVTVWLAIDDADEENAAMEFIPGTHTKGHLRWRQAKGEVVLGQEIEGIENLGSPVYDELKAGQISLHADMLAHGSKANTSLRRRCGLTIRYCPPNVNTGDSGWNHNSILARGVDPTGHWANNPRPLGEDITATIFASQAG